MSRDRIEWDGATYWTKSFNPYIGCRKCSEACENCYAEAMVKRFRMNGGCGFAPSRQSEKTMIPSRGVVFCGNMTDLYGDWVTSSERRKWYSMMFSRRTENGLAPNKASYLWLTKRAETLATDLRSEFSGTSDSTMLHPDAWYGVTAENQTRYDERISRLRSVPGIERCANVWVSCEPLLGPVDLKLDENRFVRWVVVGCESGQSRRFCGGSFIKWYQEIVHQCFSSGVPVFVKQIPVSEPGRSSFGWQVGKDISRFPYELQFRQVPFPH